MRNADDIIDELEYQREEKINTINMLRQQIEKLEKEVNIYDNLLTIPPDELSKFAAVVANLGSHPPRRTYTQNKQEQAVKESANTVQAIHDINKEIKQTTGFQTQPVQPKKETKKNTGFSGIMKKKDTKQENSEKKQPNYYDDGDDDWGNGEFY